ncbi:MAG: carboxypeptidase-like regulatory domain-containing protein, partial [Flavobacteriales bacterium]
MRLGLFIVFTCFSFLTLLAQTEVEIEGRVFSQEDHLPLEAASIYALNKADSSLVAYSISDEKGQFSLAKKTRAKTLELYVSFIGYKTFRKTLNAENAPFQLGEINLSESGLLDEVELAIAPPVSIKKDT